VLVRLGFNDFTIRLNHRKILEGQLNAWGVIPEQHISVLATLDKLEKIGVDGIEHELLKKGISEIVIEDILTSVKWLNNFYASKSTLKQWNEVVLDSLYEQLDSLDNDTGRRGIDELRSIIKYAEASNIANRIKIDPSLARGLSYYTGAIMEIGVEGIGSLGGGGRYDNLVGMFSKVDVPACGFSLGLERIIVVMDERGLFKNLTESPADVLVTILDEESISYSLALATELRAAELRVDVYPEVVRKKPGKAFFYADSRKIPFVAVLGQSERESLTVGVKDMNEGFQKFIQRNQIVDEICLGIKERKQAENEKRDKFKATLIETSKEQ
jgi:histidyl-tRNA synthetase